MSKVDRYGQRKEGQERTSKNSKSSRITNSNIVMISLSDSMEDKRYEGYKKAIPSTATNHSKNNSSSSLNSGLKFEHIKKVIPKNYQVEYAFQR